MTQLLGVRYLGESEGTGQFDVLAVTVGRQSTLFGNGPLLDFHRLGVRDTGDTVTRGADQGTTDYLASGVVESPNSVTAATGLARADLDDASTLADHIGLDFPLGTERDLETARMLVAQSDSETNASERLTLAGILHALANDSTDLERGTPQYEGCGEMYRWDLDGSSLTPCGTGR